MDSEASHAVPVQRERGPRRWRRRLLLVAAALAAVVLLSGAGVALEARGVERELRVAAEEVLDLRDRVLDSDEATAETLASLQERARSVDATTSRPHWWIVARLPVVGPTVDAVRTVASVTHDLATDALPALTEATDLVNPETLAPQDGRIDLEPLATVAPAVVAADASVQQAALRLGEIDTSRLLADVGAPVEELREMVEDVAMTTPPKRYWLTVRSR